jgi:hypothetical protein
MKKIGIIPLIIYILYTLAGGGLAIYCRLAIDQLGEDAGFNGLGLALVMVVGMVIAVVGLIGVILKALHLKTESIVFGSLCSFFDVFCICSLLDVGTGATAMDVIVSVLPFLSVIAVTLICNLISLKK